MMDFTLNWDAFGRLLLKTAAGEWHEGVLVVRAFPIAAPQEGIALVSQDGRELAWIARLDALPQSMQALVRAELAEREFMPEIHKIHQVSSFATPSTWQVATHCGETQLVLKGEEDIRRLGAAMLLITDSHGIQFLIRDLHTLDRHSRKLLDRFL